MKKQYCRNCFKHAGAAALMWHLSISEYKKILKARTKHIVYTGFLCSLFCISQIDKRYSVYPFQFYRRGESMKLFLLRKLSDCSLMLI